MKFSRLCLFFFLCSFASLAYSNCCEEPTCTFPEEKTECCCSKFTYLEPPCFKLEGFKEFAITGEFLYWFQKQNDLDFAISTEEAFTPPSGISPVIPSLIKEGNYISPDFQYHPGFRVGIGAVLEKNFWKLDWTHFNNSSSKTATAKENGNLLPLNPLSPFDGLASSKASSHVDLNFNMMDFDINRPFYVGKNLLIRPTFGLRGIWTKQTVKNEYENAYLLAKSPQAALQWDILYNTTIGPDTLNHHTTYETWSMGLLTGLGFDWFLTRQFSIFSNGSFAILYDRTKIDTKDIAPNMALALGKTDPVIYSITNQKENNLNGTIQGNLGLNWGTTYRNCYHFDLSLAYEFLYVVEHYQFDILSASLFFHGLNVKARFDF